MGEFLNAGEAVMAMLKGKYVKTETGNYVYHIDNGILYVQAATKNKEEYLRDRMVCNGLSYSFQGNFTVHEFEEPKPKEFVVWGPGIKLEPNQTALKLVTGDEVGEVELVTVDANGFTSWYVMCFCPDEPVHRIAGIPSNGTAFVLDPSGKLVVK